jgi:hypothetical protein
MRGDHVDDAAKGAGAVEVGAAAGRDGHGFDCFGGDFVPVDPSAEGVIHGDVVLEDEGSAGRGGSESAQGDALTGRILNARTGAAEEFEAGLLAEFVVEGDGGIVGEVARAEGVDGVCRGGHLDGGARGRDGDLLADSGWMEDEVDVVGGGLRGDVQGVGFQGASGGAEDQCGARIRSGTRIWVVQREVAACI